ncbi:MAG: hypothetical protein KAX44_06930, partial [Candidatus Brocadiae bacterium]|nr:hypothetical protein [Candidatus Brocadiia bacterium]
HLDYARQVLGRLRDAEVRASCHERNETMGYKVRAGTVSKIPYLLIVGDREVQDGTVSVRSHDHGDEGPVGVEEFPRRVREEIEQKRLPAGFRVAFAGD